MPFLQAILEKAGYAVTETAEGHPGLQFVETCRPAVACVDLCMPGQEGLETMVVLRRRTPALQIIAMSGGGQRGRWGDLPAARLMCAQRAIRQPFTPPGGAGGGPEPDGGGGVSLCDCVTGGLDRARITAGA